MKQISYPPIIILLDILFVFLFILILNQKKVIDIQFPLDRVFKGGKILYKDSEGYYRDQNGIIYSSTKDEGINHLLLDCTTQLGCDRVREKYSNQGVFILLPQQIFTQMAEISMLAFGMEVCDNLKFFIKKNGALDYPLIINENECLVNIPGFEKAHKL